MPYIKKIFSCTCMLFCIIFHLSYSAAKEIEEIENFLNLKNLYLNDFSYIHNNYIKLISLNEVEEAHEVPVVIKLPKDLANAKQVVILIDNNPIQLAAKVFPHKSIKSLGLNIRLEQDSLVRAVVLDQNNVWHVNSKKILVNSPGGCSLPSCNPEKELCEVKELGIIKFNKYKRSSGNWRYKISINHPMDTGLVTDSKTGKIIPEYFINQITFNNSKGIPLAKAETYGALSANPVIIIDFFEDFNLSTVIANDTKGKVFELNKE